MRLLKSDYIYEWDFRSYFDSLYIKNISRELGLYGVPKDWIHKLERVNASPIKPSCDPHPEDPEIKRQQRLERWLNNWFKVKAPNLEVFKNLQPNQLPRVVFENTDRVRQDVRVLVPADTPKELKKLLFPDTRAIISNIRTFDSELPRVEYRLLDWLNVGYIGVPQGSPTSPILSNLIGRLWVEHGAKKGVEIIMYADDSVGFSDHPIDIEVPRLMGGVKIAPEKSGYVKYAGKWIKPLKFLGLECDGKLFKASTRKGSKLELGYREHLLGELFEQLHDKVQALSVEEGIKLLEESVEKQDYPTAKGSWLKLFNSKLAGWIVNRMQSGSWDQQDLEQNFRMTFSSSSWMNSKLCHHELNVFNSSSYASLSLLNMFRWNSKMRRYLKKSLLRIEFRPRKTLEKYAYKST